jgi:hypothetical protein
MVIHSYANGHSNSYAYTDGYAEMNPDTKATADTAASPIVRRTN